jgi:type I restriction enzyme M protein
MVTDRPNFNATPHGVRDIDDNRLSSLIGRINEKRLSLGDVEADIIGRSSLCYPIGTFPSISRQRTV